MQWVALTLLLPFFVALMLAVGHYASQLEAAYQPGLQGGSAAPESYTQDRVSWRLPALSIASPTPNPELQAKPNPS